MTAASPATPGNFRLGEVFGAWLVGMRRGFLPLLPVAAACLSLSFLPRFVPWLVPKFLIAPLFMGLPFGSAYGNFLYYLAQAFIFAGACRAVSGEAIGLGASIRSGVLSVPSLLVLIPLSWIAILMGFAVFAIPGLVLVTVLAVVVPACIVERIGPFAALARSGELTEGHRWKILGIYLVRAVLGLIASSLLSALAIAFAPHEFLVYTATILFVLRVVLLVIATLLDAAIYQGLRAAREGAPAERIAAIFD